MPPLTCYDVINVEINILFKSPHHSICFLKLESVVLEKSYLKV